jgi:hypothetical protein
LFLTALAGCTVYRAWRNWRPPARKSAVVEQQAFASSGDEAAPNYFADDTGAEQPPTGTARQQIAQALERGKQAAIAASRKAVVAFKAGINAARDHSAKT